MLGLIEGVLLDYDFVGWEFENKKGITHYLTVKDSDKKLHKVIVKEENINQTKFESLIRCDVEVKVSIFNSNGKTRLTLIDIKEI